MQQPVNFVLQLQDKLSGPFKKVNDIIDKTVAPVNRLTKAFGGLAAKANITEDKLKAFSKASGNIKKGMEDINKANATLAAGGAIVGAGLGFSLKKAMEFEDALAQLNSVSDLTKDQFRAIETQALQLGASTVFSSTEAVQGMLELSKAGLSVEQTMQAIPGVLSAAATEGIGLGQASEIIVGILQGQNLEMGKASMVSDVLAKTANKTSAGIVDLGEAFKYANTLSQQGLLTFEDTSTALGILSNAGLKGSVAGTSLVAMYNQITKPSEKVLKMFGGQVNMLKLFTDTATGKMKSLPEIIEVIGKSAAAQGNDFKKMAFLTDFVGVEGAKAFGALQRAMGAKDAEGRPMFQGLREDIGNAGGAAEDMANKRLNSITGVLKIVGSAVENIGILIGQVFQADIRSAANFASTYFGQISDVLMVLRKNTNELTKGDYDLLKSPLGEFIVGLKEGLMAGISIIKTTISTIVSIGNSLSIFSAGNESVGKMVGMFLTLSAALAPILIGMAGFGMIVTNLIGGVTGLISIFTNLAPILSLVFRSLVPLGITVLQALWGVMLANPITAAIIGFTALAVIVYKNWDLFKKWGGYILEFFNPVIDSISAKFTGLKSMLPDFIAKKFDISTKVEGPKPVLNTTKVSTEIINSQKNKNETSVNVNFSNMPKGTKVEPEKSKTPVNLSLGYSMGS